MRDRWARLAGLIAIAVIPTPAYAAHMPSASFDVTPINPRVGEQIQLVSSSCDPVGQLASQDWDLNGDGFYDDATGSTASATLMSAGAHVIGLQVTSASGEVVARTRTVIVDRAGAPTRPTPAQLVSPFPVVTLGGQVRQGSTDVNLFMVRAPVCATVSVTCAGRGCPLRRVTARVGRVALRIREMERRFRAANRLTLAVSKGGLVGKLTEFRFRRGRPPLRTDRCLAPGSTEGFRCPSG